MIRVAVLLGLLLAGCAEMREVVHLGQPAGHADEGRK